VHVSYGGETKVFDASGVSVTKTAVLAWRNGVVHEMVGLQAICLAPC
jgi:hypothetical protein